MEVRIIPYKHAFFSTKSFIKRRQAFSVQNNLLKEGELVHGQMIVNTFVTNQCVLSDMKIYNIPIG